LAPLLFDDEELTEERKLRDPVAPAQPSAAAKSKKAKRITEVRDNAGRPGDPLS
jgi:hypothetical protein